MAIAQPGRTKCCYDESVVACAGGARDAIDAIAHASRGDTES